MANVELQPNSGGFDHTYTYCITTELPQRVKAGEASESLDIS